MKKIVSVFLLGFLLTNLHAQRGRVQIQDGTLVTDKGTLLRGAHSATHERDFHDSTWITREYFKKLKDSGLNCIRTFTESPWRPDTAGSRAAFVDSIVKWTRQESMYLIITWGGWTPAYDTNGYRIGHQFNKDFWSFYAPRYKDETHVIYEITNEPGPSNNLPAPDYRSFDSSAIDMEIEIYNLIRSYAPESHILLMSPYEFTYNQFTNDIKRLGSAIDWSNASIAGHAYTYSPQDYIQAIQKVKNEGYAITVTEFHSFLNEYANMALTKVFNDEFVSHFHFLSARQIVENNDVFKSKVESSNERWTPDFGTWPESITETNYQNPYRYWPAIFHNDGAGWVSYIEEEMISYISNNDYMAYYNIDFQNGPAIFEAFCSATASDGRIELRLDSLDGLLVGICQLASTGSLDNYEAFTCNDITPFTGVHDLYLKFRRNDDSPMFNLRSWYFGQAESEALQTPYNEVASVIPGKIEAEKYDIGGSTISFLDMDTSNQGSLFRNDEVDIDTTTDGGYCIAWTEECEWLEYMVNCEKDTVMDIQLRTACWESGNKFNIKLNNEKLATVYLDSVGSYQDWRIITIEDIIIPAGKNQILRLELLDGNFNLDWLNFVAKEVLGLDEENSKESITFYPNPASDYLTIQSPEGGTLEVYSMQGQLLLSKKLDGTQQTVPVGRLKPGNYVVKLVSKSEVSAEILIIE